MLECEQEGKRAVECCTQAVPACRCIDALVTMGVLVPGGDRTAVRRTAEFFLKNFEVTYQVPCRLLTRMHVCLTINIFTNACWLGSSPS